MDEILRVFFDKVETGEIDIYNEFSLQHELGIFLRRYLPDKKVQFERNVSFFDLNKADFEKKEIDIAVFDTGGLDFVIELKYPRNGQVPESMYSFCKDICFLEQLVCSGFKSGYFIAVADDPLFYSGKSEGIYRLFRAGYPISGIISKPTGKKDTQVKIQGCYNASWKSVSGNTKYCTIEVSS